MQLDQGGIDLLKQYEGFSAFPYQDTAGHWTIGYGHLILETDNFQHDLSIEQAEFLLLTDAQIAVDAVNRLVNVGLSQNQFNSLVSFTFNLGAGAFAGSSLLREINAGDFSNINHNFYAYNKVRKNGVLVFNQGLANRREQEARIFDNVKSLVLLAAVGFVGWKVYQASNAVENAVDTVDDARISVGQAIGSKLYDIFNWWNSQQKTQ